ncbi:MAG: response regulator transcription factor [Planctomycetaceae bacterium]|jgi:two-component system phosphate regulon response regulator PhoB|nr:response regulator transcription factor [Planctomycetaceae bacterium]
MSKERILIIEDEADILSMVSLRLKSRGYEVHGADSGLVGLKLIAEWRPDLVLLDLMLPELGGLDLLRHVRSDKRFTRMPILIISALGEESDVVVGLELGADDYLSKPFNMSVLVARVNALLRRVKADSDDDISTSKSDSAAASSSAVSASSISADSNNDKKNTKSITFGSLRIDAESYKVFISEKQIILTGTEYRLLVALLSAKGRVLTRNQLIDAAIGNDAIVIDRTIDVHLASLRSKLGEMREIIETVRGVGYRISQ